MFCRGDIYLANDIFIEEPNQYGSAERIRRRLEYQEKAKSNARLVGYLAQIALEQKAITYKQYEIIANLCADITYMTAAWIKSDAARIKKLASGTL